MDNSFSDSAKGTTNTRSGDNNQGKPLSHWREDVLQSQRDLASAATTGQVPVDEEDTTDTIVESAQTVGGAKEQKEIGPISRQPEKIQIIEHKEPEPGPEVKDWLKKVEGGESAQLPQPVTDDYGQILVASAAPKKPKIILPLSEQKIEQGFQYKVVDSIRWLAEWCVRVMKMATGRVFYKTE